MWRSCFRKTLCGLKRNKGCWLNARRTKRMRLSVKLAEVSVSVDLFLQCPSQVAPESSLSLASLARRLVKVVIAELGD